ncbi:t-SNARE [Phaeosphaeriaceae sp. PMI808]|nr:t-SNARE [Phaeosphaeriaceae sp. PMI808]
MSQNYQQYSSNPYGQADTGYGQSNPYGSGGGYGSSNPYGGGGVRLRDTQHNAPAAQPSQYSQPQATGAGLFGDSQNTNAQPQQTYQAAPLEQHGSQPLTRDAFLERIEGTKQRIGQLTTDIQSISNIHQRMLSAPENRNTAELEAIVTQTQIRNTQIKDEIKFLEKDAVRDPNSSYKRTQVSNLKNTFTTRLKDFQKEEADYSKRYRDAIERQYRIINPDATDAEAREAANADWGDEGVFTQALKSNRSGQASSALGAVRARHNDIQQIEKTMSELALLFTQLNEQVVYQEAQVAQVEEQTAQVHKDTENANTQLETGIRSARRARKLKWWCLGITILILAIIALALGIYFGVVVPRQDRDRKAKGL